MCFMHGVAFIAQSALVGDATCHWLHAPWRPLAGARRKRPESPGNDVAGQGQSSERPAPAVVHRGDAVIEMDSGGSGGGC